MDMMNVFTQDAFSALSLTSAIDKRPFNPTGLGSLNLFEPLPIRTTALAVEERLGKLVLIPTSPRGAPATERTTEKRNIRYFTCPRLFHADTLYASELQDVREFVGDSGIANTVLMQVQSEVARRLSGPTGLQASMEYTWEYHRLGAVQGILLDATGAVINNWFTEFGISQPSAIAFSLASGATAATGTIRPLCNGIVRTMSRAGAGIFVPNKTRVIGLCGDQFFDEFTNHMDVKQTYLNWTAAADLRQGQAFQSFSFAGIEWINYRGSDDTTTVAIATNTVKFFPADAPGAFQVAWAPAEAAQWVNQPGKPIYVQPIIDRDRNEWVRMEVKSYPLHICTRPEMLLSGTA